jgi:hypothetical protein
MNLMHVTLHTEEHPYFKDPANRTDFHDFEVVFELATPKGPFEVELVVTIEIHAAVHRAMALIRKCIESSGGDPLESNVEIMLLESRLVDHRLFRYCEICLDRIRAGKTAEQKCECGESKSNQLVIEITTHGDDINLQEVKVTTVEMMRNLFDARFVDITEKHTYTADEISDFEARIVKLEEERRSRLERGCVTKVAFTQTAVDQMAGHFGPFALPDGITIRQDE